MQGCPKGCRDDPWGVPGDAEMSQGLWACPKGCRGVPRDAGVSWRMRGCPGGCRDVPGVGGCPRGWGMVGQAWAQQRVETHLSRLVITQGRTVGSHGGGPQWGVPGAEPCSSLFSRPAGTETQREDDVHRGGGGTDTGATAIVGPRGERGELEVGRASVLEPITSASVRAGEERAALWGGGGCG